MDADILFPRIARASHEQKLRILLIGGHAVNAYGYARTTLDSDFLISEKDLATWRKTIESWGFVIALDTEAFMKFKYLEPSPEAYTLDVMKVAPDTFDKLWLKKRELPFGPDKLAVAHPTHIIALKLHAMRHPPRFEQGKDMPDILHLIRVCQIDTSDADFQNIFSRYADEKTRTLFDSFLRTKD